MSPTRMLALIAAIAVLPASAEARLATRREQSQDTVAGRGLNGVVVESERAFVRLGPSPDGSIHLTALKLIHSPGDTRAMELAAGIKVQSSTEGGRYVVRVRYPERRQIRVSFWQLLRGEFDIPRVQLRLALDVPAGLPVSVRSSSGDVESADLPNPLAIHTSSGDVDVAGTSGGLSIETSSGDVAGRNLASARVVTSSGDVALDGIRGVLVLRTSSGDLIIAGARDSLDIETTSGDASVSQAPRGLAFSTESGDLELNGLAGVVKVNASSGDVSAQLTPSVRAAEITTGSGELRVHLAPTLACELDLRTSSGTLDVTVPIHVRTASRRAFSGVVLGGRVPIILRTTSGDIDVLNGGK